LYTHQPGYAQRRDRESALPLPDASAYRAGDVLGHNIASVVLHGEVEEELNYKLIKWMSEGVEKINERYMTTLKLQRPTILPPGNTRVLLDVERDHV
jgi:hypothetical protein